MNNQQAVKELKERIDLIAADYKNDMPEYREMLALAVSALEKQVPKEPVNKMGLKDFNQKIYAYRGGCPVCGKDGITSIGAKYCPGCGQAIDWGGAEG